MKRFIDIQANFDGKCASSGKPIKKGDWVLYDTVKRQTVLDGSPVVLEYEKEIKESPMCFDPNWREEN